MVVTGSDGGEREKASEWAIGGLLGDPSTGLGRLLGKDHLMSGFHVIHSPDISGAPKVPRTVAVRRHSSFARASRIREGEARGADHTHVRERLLNPALGLF